MTTSRPIAVLSLLVTVGLASGAACVVEESDDDETPPTGAGGSTPLESPGDRYQSSAFLAESNLSQIVTYLASDELDGRDEGTPGGQLARTYLIEQMQSCGIQPAVGSSFEQPITTGTGTNVLGIVPGSDPALEARTVVVSAHYDHLGNCEGQICNGANDNAAGVAIALAVGCAMAEDPPPRSVLVALWDAEEPPTFLTAAMGSQFYADSPVIGLDQTDAVIALDLVGADLWPGYGGHFVLGAELSPQVAYAVDAAHEPEGLLAYRGGLHLAEEQPLGLGRQPWSDYDAFRNKNLPILFLSNGQNKQYHTSADELDGLNLPKMELEARYLVAIVGNLAHGKTTPVFDAAGSDYPKDAAAMKEALAAALAAGGLLDVLGLTAKSRTKLEGDLTDVTAIADKLAAGGQLTEPEIRRLRDATQRIMCHAGSSYPEAICNAF